jgi:hypothetical protein
MPGHEADDDQAKIRRKGEITAVIILAGLCVARLIRQFENSDREVGHAWPPSFFLANRRLP